MSFLLIDNDFLIIKSLFTQHMNFNAQLNTLLITYIHSFLSVYTQIYTETLYLSTNYLEKIKSVLLKQNVNLIEMDDLGKFPSLSLVCF
jgi:hypothetical protein